MARRTTIPRPRRPQRTNRPRHLPRQIALLSCFGRSPCSDCALLPVPCPSLRGNPTQSCHPWLDIRRPTQPFIGGIENPRKTIFDALFSNRVFWQPSKTIFLISKKSYKPAPATSRAVLH